MPTFAVSGSRPTESTANNVAGAGPGGNNSRDHEPPRVKIGGAMMPADELTVLGWTRSFGGARVDQAQVVHERGGKEQRFIQNVQLRPQETGRTLEIIHRGKRAFWGVIEDATLSFGDAADSKILVATIQPYHFGYPVVATQYLTVSRDYSGRDTVSVVSATEPIVFNGPVDPNRRLPGEFGRNLPANKAYTKRTPLKKRDGKDTSQECYALISFTAAETTNARLRYQSVWPGIGDNQAMWTLQDAVEYLCVLANEEQYIANPTPDEYQKLPRLILPRTELKLGKYLPAYLDEMLLQYGYGWSVEVDQEKPRIAFHKWGNGPEVSAKYAPVGSPADFGTTNLQDVNAAYAASQVINEVHCIGDLVEYEGTFELSRATEDKWVLNESGDYITSTYPQYRRPGEEVIRANRVAVPRLEQLLPSYELGEFGSTSFVQRIHRRRRFLPMMTQLGIPTTGGDTRAIDVKPKGPVHGCIVEIIELNQETVAEASKVWITKDKTNDAMFRHIRIAEDECAIEFDRGRDARGADDESDEASEAIDLFLEALGEGARIRLTGVIQADFAIQARVARDTKSPSAGVGKRAFVWHDPDRWKCRRVIRTGPYASQHYSITDYDGQTQPADSVVADMRRAARALLDRLDAATISGTIVFNNLDESVPLGGIVKSIEGRTVAFNTRDGKDSPQYPQIVAVQYDAQAAIIIATLSTEPANSLEAFA